MKRLPLTHLLLIIATLIALAAIAWFYTNANEPVEGIPMAETVRTDTAPIDSDFKMTEETCEAQGGIWNECASPCLPDAEVCTQVCIQRCEGLTTQNVTVKAFFPKRSDKDVAECSLVYPITRMTRTKSLGVGNEPVYEAALDELMKGPGPDEGVYFTSLPAGSGFENLSFKNGTAYVEFLDSFEGVAGLCRVQLIRAQIEATLKQFPEVKDVVITSHGNADSVLQP